MIVARLPGSGHRSLTSMASKATETGFPVWRGEFAPFGEELDTEATLNHYKFTGKERDTESGLDYFGARFYASTAGRFMSPDWSAKAEPVPYSKLDDPQSLNLYAYVHNNPLNSVDVDGHLSIDGAPPVPDNLSTEVSSETAAESAAETARIQQGKQAQQQPNRPSLFTRFKSWLVRHLPLGSAGATAYVAPEEEKESNAGVGLAADLGSVVSSTPGLRPIIGVPGGTLASVISVRNDSSRLNFGINETGLFLAFIGIVAEDTAAGAASGPAGYGLSIGAFGYDSANFFTGGVLSPMAMASDSQTRNADGQTVPNPDMSLSGYPH